METAGTSSPAVTKIPGEPAMLIIGLPNPTSKSNLESNSRSKNQESNSRSELEPDPHFGEWLVGRKVRKLFGDFYYFGKVVSYDKEENWYRVQYEDGDLEDLDWYELETVLVPLDISIPLKDLALNLGNWDNNNNNNNNNNNSNNNDGNNNNSTASKSGLKRGRVKRENSVTGTAGLESGLNDLALVPVKIEKTEEKEEVSLVSKNNKRGRKPRGDNNGNKNDEKLIILKDEEKTGEASRRKKEGKRRELMSTVKAERLKRKEQQSQR